MPKISVIIPVYNVEPYLRECLDSVCAQTFNDIEVICVDDGSTDSSPAILEEYARKDKRFKIILREHSNAGVCRNIGLDMACGEYLSFLDSDDVFAPKMLEIMFNVAVVHAADIVSCSQHAYRDGEKQPKLDSHICGSCIRNITNPAKTTDIYSLWVGRAWDKLFSKRFIDINGLRFQEIRSTNDMRFVYSALALAKNVIMLDSVLIAHRFNATSLEATRSKGALCIVEALKSYDSDMRRLGVFNRYSRLEHLFKIWIVNIMFWYMDTIDTIEAYQVVHRAFREICEHFRLSSITKDDFRQRENVFLRFDKIRNGCTPIESLRFHEHLLIQEVAELGSNRHALSSLDYRIGRLLLAVPRLLKRTMMCLKQVVK